MHSSDHSEFATHPINQAALRLRVPPPAAKRIAPIDRRKLTRRIDFFKYWMAWRMFFAPTNISLLQDTEYRFEEPDQRQAADDFLRELRDADAEMPVLRSCRSTTSPAASSIDHSAARFAPDGLSHSDW